MDQAAYLFKIFHPSPPSSLQTDDQQIFNATTATIYVQSWKLCKMSTPFRTLKAATGRVRIRTRQKFCLPSTREVSKVTFAALRLPAGKFKPIFSNLSRNDLPPFFDLALEWQRNECAESKLKECPQEKAGGGWGEKRYLWHIKDHQSLKVIIKLIMASKLQSDPVLKSHRFLWGLSQS